MEKVNDIVCKTLSQRDHMQKDNSMNAFGDKPRSLKKVIDYLSLFLEVNQEIIASNSEKIKKRKVTNRYPMTPLFLQATECM